MALWTVAFMGSTPIVTDRWLDRRARRSALGIGNWWHCMSCGRGI